MSATHIALIRGINVGKAKRISMTDLKTLVEGLGYREAKTLLNSGNVVFTARAKPEVAAARIEKALLAQTGVSARVTVLAAAELAEVVTANPLAPVADDPARHLVAVLNSPADRSRVEPLLKQDWTPGRFALGTRVAYLWCPDGILESKLNIAIGKALKDAVTSRNWATILKLHGLVIGAGG